MTPKVQLDVTTSLNSLSTVKENIFTDDNLPESIENSEVSENVNEFEKNIGNTYDDDLLIFLDIAGSGDRSKATFHKYFADEIY